MVLKINGSKAFGLMGMVIILIVPGLSGMDLVLLAGIKTQMDGILSVHGIKLKNSGMYMI